MSDDNPSAQPPQPVLAERAGDQDFALTGPHLRTAGSGAQWLAEAFAFFRKGWLQWIAAGILLMAIYILVQLIPILGPIAIVLIGPVFSGGLMMGAREQERGKHFQVGFLFAGFSHNPGGLLTLGALYLVLQIIAWTLAIGLVSLFIGGAELFGALSAADTGVAEPISPAAVLLGVLIVLAVAIPTAAAIWLAPPLVALHDVPALQAMKMSLIGCLRNILPFLIYGLLGVVLAFVASVPLFLGWLVLVPVIFLSVYTAYRDIFCDTPADPRR